MLLGGCGKSDVSSKMDRDKTVTIGVTQIVEHPSLDAAYKGFQKGVKDGGVQHVDFKYKVAQGEQTNSVSIAKTFVGDKVDLIFANATPSAQHAANATKRIPIVFTSVTDPVGAKLVKSLEAPGTNVTGTTDTHPEAIPKTVEFIGKEIKAKSVGLLYNKGEQNSVVQIEKVKQELKKYNVKAVEATVAKSADVKQAAASLVGRADAFYVVTDNTVVSTLPSVISVAESKKIPLFVGELDSVKKGGFAAYGFDYYDIGYQAGKMAAKILKDGKKPSDLPVEFPKKLKLVINKKAAAAMNVKLNPKWNSIAEYID
nr:ABC transporter substrate-binding protein [Fictibacillus macauensis]